MYLERTGYCIIKEDKTTPNVIVFSISFISLSGRVATSATDSAPLIPPIITTCLHAPGVFSFVKRCVTASIGYVDTALAASTATIARSEEHTSELQSRRDLVCRLLLEKKKKKS